MSACSAFARLPCTTEIATAAGGAPSPVSVPTTQEYSPEPSPAPT
jgi:hypothetical protein